MKLGRKAATSPPVCVRLARHWDGPGDDYTLPDETHWGAKAAKSIAQPLGNTQAGCCVISEAMHLAGIQTADDVDGGGEAVGTDREALTQYRQICGPGDNGCVMVDVLEHRRLHGITAGGRVHKVDDYCCLDVTNWDLVRFAVSHLGPISIGFSLPESWLNSAEWDVTESPIAGGHDVCAYDYTPDGLLVASWGRTYLFTRAALAGGRYVDEAYVPLSPDWYGADHLSPAGLDVDALRAALASIRSGVVPPDPVPPTPTPPVPVPPAPVPPYPPQPPTTFRVHLDVRSQPDGVLTHTVDGTAVYAAESGVLDSGGSSAERVFLDLGSPAGVRGVAALLFPVIGIRVEQSGSTLVVVRKDLTPAQWAKLVQVLVALAEAIAQILAGQ